MFDCQAAKSKACNLFTLQCLDMWAMGAIMAELLTLRPLFPGSRYHLMSLQSLLHNQYISLYLSLIGNNISIRVTSLSQSYYDSAVNLIMIMIVQRIYNKILLVADLYFLYMLLINFDVVFSSAVKQMKSTKYAV